MSHIIEGHTVVRFDGELSHLHMLMVEMGGLVVEQLQQSLQCLVSKDIESALKVIDRDNDVDELELKVDAEIRSILARRTPVARDLRAVLACSKSVTDIERIGDEAGKLARLAVQIYDGNGSSPNKELLRDVVVTGKVVSVLLREAMTVFDHLDDKLAENLLERTRELEGDFQSSVRRMATYMMEDSRNVGHAIRVVLALKSLERIGDHAKNIAEQIIFLVRGEDIRHRHDLRESEGASISN